MVDKFDHHAGTETTLPVSIDWKTKTKSDTEIVSMFDFSKLVVRLCIAEPDGLRVVKNFYNFPHYSNDFDFLYILYVLFKLEKVSISLYPPQDMVIIF